MLKTELLAGVCCLLASCATVFKGGRRKRMTIDSEPRGAKVYLNGQSDWAHAHGAPGRIEGTPTPLEFRQDGFETRIRARRALRRRRLDRCGTSFSRFS